MIKTTNCVTFTRKQHFNYMYKYVYLPQSEFVDDMLCSLEFVFRNNYNSNSDIRRNIIEVKYIREKR